MIEQVPELPGLKQLIPVFPDLFWIHVAGSYTKNPQSYKRAVLEISQIDRTFSNDLFFPGTRRRTA
jgi:hypothetical protein